VPYLLICLKSAGSELLASGCFTKSEEVQDALKKASHFDEKDQRIKEVNHLFVMKLFGLHKEGDNE
jgi:hypothetical protein